MPPLPIRPLIWNSRLLLWENKISARSVTRTVSSSCVLSACRSRQSCEDGWGNVTVKLISPRPRGASLRSPSEPARASPGPLPAATSPQCDSERQRVRARLSSTTSEAVLKSATSCWHHFSNPPERKTPMKTSERHINVGSSWKRDSTCFWASCALLPVFWNSCK